MYEAIEGFLDAGTDGASVWRYMNLSKLESLLHEKALFFANMWVLAQDDKYEGVYPRANYDRVIEHLSSLPPDADPLAIFSARASAVAHDELVARSRTNTYVNCWHMSDHESDAMWRKYLRKKLPKRTRMLFPKLYSRLYLTADGTVVKSTIARLISSLRDAPGVQQIAAVRYIDYTAAPAMPSHAQLLRHKRHVFDYEKEVRVITYETSPPGLFKSIAAGVFVPVALDDLIEEIYVSPRSSAQFVAIVRSLLKKYGVSKPVKTSEIDVDPSTAGAALANTSHDEC